MEIHPLADLSMLLVDEAHMTNLHEKWMEEPGPTDVLSFPMDELRPHSIAGAEPDQGPRRRRVASRSCSATWCSARRSRPPRRSSTGHSTQDELELLTVHGVLHLLGYDHADPEEEAEMFGLQSELLRDWRDQLAGGPPGGGKGRKDRPDVARRVAPARRDRPDPRRRAGARPRRRPWPGPTPTGLTATAAC